MSIVLRPVLRPSTLPSLLSSSSSTTYTCQACRHARLLRRPKRPYTFTQLVTLSDGSAFMMRTTSPQPVYRSTRDTRNSPLWNPTSRELMNVEDDEAGRLAGFRARFGKGFDAQREAVLAEDVDETTEGARVELPSSTPSTQANAPTTTTDAKQSKQDTSSKPAPVVYEDEMYDFGEDDANLVDLISSYGQQDVAPQQQPPPPPAKSKKGKK